MLVKKRKKQDRKIISLNSEGFAICPDEHYTLNNSSRWGSGASFKK